MKLFRIIGVSAFLSFTQPAWAEESGLPQFDTALFPEQLFWLAITFALLYVMMAFVALPRVTGTKDNRKQIISTELTAAKDASEASKLAIAAVEKSLAEARGRAQVSVAEMLAQLSADTSAQQAAQEKELKRKLHRAEADIAVTREAALKTIQGGAADLAALVVEKITGAKARVS